MVTRSPPEQPDRKYCVSWSDGTVTNMEKYALTPLLLKPNTIRSLVTDSTTTPSWLHEISTHTWSSLKDLLPSLNMDDLYPDPDYSNNTFKKLDDLVFTLALDPTTMPGTLESTLTPPPSAPDLSMLDLSLFYSNQHKWIAQIKGKFSTSKWSQWCSKINLTPKRISDLPTPDQFKYRKNSEAIKVAMSNTRRPKNHKGRPMGI